MLSKTPQFDKILNKILEELSPHIRECKWSGKHSYCENKFKIEAEDIEFLKLLRAPAPNFCPTCRRMRRFVHMNLTQLFKSKCDIPNHGEEIISIFPEECPFPVYDYQYFIGDDFDPPSFGKEYQPKNNPMKMLLNFRKEFPVPSFLNRNLSSVNSDYSNGGRDLKNGYYVMACYHVEDAWYSLMINKSRNVMDSYSIRASEFVYRGVSSDYLYNSSYIFFSINCTDSMFLFDCRNCQDCFGCVNLRNKKYCIFNEQLKKEEYKNFINSVTPLTREIISKNEKKFWTLVKNCPMNGPRNIASSNVYGVKILNSRNLFDVTEVNNSENIRHADGASAHNDSMDFLYSGGKSNMLYMNTNIGSYSSRVKFSVSSKFCTDCDFIFNCKNLNDCFMCFGLHDKSHCILNKQYEEVEYYKIIDQIKTDMLNRGEYSDGPGIEFSAQAYNFSPAQLLFPLSNDEIKKLGGFIAKNPETNVGGMKILKPNQIPQTIEEVTDDVLDKAIYCEISGRPFRIISSELAFYRRRGIPLPTVHPSLRMENNYKLSPVGKKYKTNCAKCNKEIETLFNPKEGFLLYCEDCYKREII